MAACRVVFRPELSTPWFQVTLIPEQHEIENSRRVVPITRLTSGCEGNMRTV
jgi:hypothetical protein